MPALSAFLALALLVTVIGCGTSDIPDTVGTPEYSGARDLGVLEFAVNPQKNTVSLVSNQGQALSPTNASPAVPLVDYSYTLDDRELDLNLSVTNPSENICYVEPIYYLNGQMIYEDGYAVLRPSLPRVLVRFHRFQ